MGEHADIKLKKLLQFLKWLGKKSNITIKLGGNHQYSVKCTGWERPYPIPLKHGVVNKHIIKGLIEQLIKSEICTKEEIDKEL